MDLISPNFFAQRTSNLAFKNTSPNNDYTVVINGSYYEGFVGSQKVSLLDISGNVIWEKLIPKNNNIQKPIVSNIGEVALPLTEGIRFYDQFGEIKGTYSPNTEEKLCYKTDWPTAYAYSLDGKNYYTFLLKKNGRNSSILFVSMTNSGRINWKIDLGNYRPSYIQFHTDRIIIDDFSGASMHYVNRCYIFDEIGSIISYYDVDLHTVHYPPIIIESINEIWIYDEKDIKSYDSYKGTFKREVMMEELTDLLFESDPRKLDFALYILTYKSSLKEFPEPAISRLQELAMTKGDINERRSYYIGKMSSELLKKISD